MARKPDKTSVKDWLSSKLDDELDDAEAAAAGPDPATEPVSSEPSAPRQRPARGPAPRRAEPLHSEVLPEDAWAEIDDADPPTEQLAVVEERRTSPSVPLPVQAGPSVSHDDDGDRKTRPLPTSEDAERTSTRGRPGVPSYTGGQEPGRLTGAVPPRPQARQGTRPRIQAPSPGGAIPRVAPLAEARPSTPVWDIGADEDVEDAPTVFTMSTATPLGAIDEEDDPRTRTSRTAPRALEHDIAPPPPVDPGRDTQVTAARPAGIAMPTSFERTPLVPNRRPPLNDSLPAPVDEDIHDAPTVAAKQVLDLSLSSVGASKSAEAPRDPAPAPAEPPDPTRAPPAMIAWMALGAVLLILMGTVGLAAALIVGLVGP